MHEKVEGTKGKDHLSEQMGKKQRGREIVSRSEEHEARQEEDGRERPTGMREENEEGNARKGEELEFQT
jgi:hypothetical protein